MSTTHQDDSIGVQQMMAYQEPLQVTPVHARIEKAVDRPVTAAFAAPARPSSHGDPTAHRPHRLDDPSQLTKRRRLSVLAYASSKDHNIGHGRLLLV